MPSVVNKTILWAVAIVVAGAVTAYYLHVQHNRFTLVPVGPHRAIEIDRKTGESWHIWGPNKKPHHRFDRKASPIPSAELGKLTGTAELSKYTSTFSGKLYNGTEWVVTEVIFEVSALPSEFDKLLAEAQRLSDDEKERESIRWEQLSDDEKERERIDEKERESIRWERLSDDEKERERILWEQLEGLPAADDDRITWEDMLGPLPAREIPFRAPVQVPLGWTRKLKATFQLERYTTDSFSCTVPDKRHNLELHWKIIEAFGYRP